ncbi:unnamed protein product [Paramecium pentaurelia]|uniref:Uncharacterized protein n=1 Tax=Paramecium pentaurelia TaxID=43138 RepID=A0A8S1YPY7_9CILI|nr:unnamed protein product [Paramecium pentaurelia]
MSEAQYWTAEGVKTQNLIYDCAGSFLYGGYGIFGVGAKISKQLELPPHTKIKFNIDIWKLDDWYEEYIQIIIDEQIYKSQLLYYSQGSQICGLLETNENELIIPIEISISHTAKFLNIIILSTVNEDGFNESWGIRNLQIQILPCPNLCTICDQEPIQICSTILIQEIKINEWNNQRGFGILDKNSVIKSSVNLSAPHYQIKVKLQLILIDIQSLINYFVLEIDDLITNIQLTSNSQLSLCGSSYQESIKNIDVSINHTNNNSIIKIRPIQLTGQNAYWGIISFDIFIIKCSDKNCLKCTEKDVCLECIDEWVVENDKCNRLQNPFKIKQIKVKQYENILLDSQQQLKNESIILNKAQTFMDLTVTTQCNQNNYIQSNFIICHACEEKNIAYFQFKCQFKLNQMITFSIKLEKLNITSEELLWRSIIFSLILLLEIKMIKNLVQQQEIIQITKQIRYFIIMK